jgi:tetratricopeptide (TPR) repeat protein
LQELLQETTAVDAALVSGARHVGDLVEQVSRELKGCSELAPAMYGCGKALERIAREGLSSFPVSAELIEVHLRLAHAIDPSLVGPMRDLALRFAEAGRLEEAGDCLKRASETAADPETLMLLAQWHSARGEYRDASYVYRGVLRLDETFAPAALELLRLDLTSRTQALYAPQLRQLFVELESLAACESLSAQDRAWARQQWERLRWLIQEGDANLPSFAARRWIPRSWRWVPTEQANRSEALPLTSAVVPAHDRDLPAALIQQTSVKQSSERPIPIPQVVRVTGPDGQSLVPTRSAEAMIPVADPGRAHREEGPAR